jgi:hypothetical protein
MANLINTGSRVFVRPGRFTPAVFGVLERYGSTFATGGSGALMHYSGGWRAFVLQDGDKYPTPHHPNDVKKDTPKNRAKWLEETK